MFLVGFLVWSVSGERGMTPPPSDETSRLDRAVSESLSASAFIPFAVGLLKSSYRLRSYWNRAFLSSSFLALNVMTVTNTRPGTGSSASGRRSSVQ